MIKRRQFSKEFKSEAVRLVRACGVSVVLAAKDLDVHENVLRKWVRSVSEDSQHAFPGHGQMKPEQAEIARLKKEVAKLKMERDILKKPRPTSPRNRCEVWLRGDAPRNLARGIDLRYPRYLVQRLLRMAHPCTEQAQPNQRATWCSDSQQLYAKRPHLWRTPSLARSAGNGVSLWFAPRRASYAPAGTTSTAQAARPPR